MKYLALVVMLATLSACRTNTKETVREIVSASCTVGYLNALKQNLNEKTRKKNWESYKKKSAVFCSKFTDDVFQNW